MYELIDGERDYQDCLPPDRTDQNWKSVGDWITLIGHYHNKLLEAYCENAGNANALDVMRKIGAIAVACMENHGAPKRGEFF